jgi:hypothetical protein
MGKFDKFCQSCGMPMEKDPNLGGTNQDGSKNNKYCSLCYVDGNFKDNFTKSSEMVRFVRDELKKQGFSFLKRWFYTSHISQLERWKN